MNQLAIFDIDGTLTDTNSVDNECYRQTVAEALGLAPAAIDWSGASHVTDSEIFNWLCRVHRRSLPSAGDVEQARRRFVDRLTAMLDSDPSQFAAIAGASRALRTIEASGWRVAVATGGWGPSARLKLGAAQIDVDHAVLASADDATSRVAIVELARTRAERFYERTFHRVVVLGDARWDVETAKILELPFIGIGTGARAAALRDAGANIVLSDYSDIDALQIALATASPPVTTG